jgi:hypothetical protein
MAGPSKKMHVSDEDVFYKLLQENEYRIFQRVNAAVIVK